MRLLVGNMSGGDGGLQQDLARRQFATQAGLQMMGGPFAQLTGLVGPLFQRLQQQRLQQVPGLSVPQGIEPRMNMTPVNVPRFQNPFMQQPTFGFGNPLLSQIRGIG